jgi:hypothetical protein
MGLFAFRFAKYKDYYTLINNPKINENPHYSKQNGNNNSKPRSIINFINQQFTYSSTDRQPHGDKEDAFYALILRTAHNINAIISRGKG